MIIPEKFQEQFGDRARYAFTSCLKELGSDISELRKHLYKHDYVQARMVLHNMLGVSKIISNWTISKVIAHLQKRKSKKPP